MPDNLPLHTEKVLAKKARITAGLNFFNSRG